MFIVSFEKAIDVLYSNEIYYHIDSYISGVDGKDQEHFGKCSILECLDSFFSTYSETMLMSSKFDL